MEVGKRVGEKGGGEEVSYRNSFNARQRLERAGGVSSQRKKRKIERHQNDLVGAVAGVVTPLPFAQA